MCSWPGGQITAIEVDYSTVPGRAVDARARRPFRRGGASDGGVWWSDAGTRIRARIPSRNLPYALFRRTADGNDGRPRLLGERGSLDARAGVDERAGGRLDPLAVELERRATPLDKVQLLLVLLIGLVVLVDDPVARVAGRPGVDAERRDAEVVPHWPLEFD